MKHSQQGWVTITLAASLSVCTMALADVNTVNDGPIVAGGTYLNTADGKTTFKNSAGGGLWLKSGSNIRGVEVDTNGSLTNNGGTVHFYAPGNVVRLDGNIDVRGIRNSQGVYRGDGGKVFVDSAYLYQSGNIYANGFNGGLVQFNVGSATLTGNARIEAKGAVGSDFTGITEGQGGVIAINASGPVDLGRQTVLDTSGKVMGSFDTNVINIEGSLVNASGLLQANGADSRGGTIRIVSTGQTDLSQTEDALSKAVACNNFTETEFANIKSRLNNLKATQDGDIVITAASNGSSQANLFANGHPGAAVSPIYPVIGNVGNDPSGVFRRAGDGGTIILTAARDINNGGWVLANGGSGDPYRAFGFSDPNVFVDGGHGGTISLTAGRNIANTGRIVSDGGNGGDSIDLGRGNGGGPAGLIAFSYDNQMQNSGVIRANGSFGAFIFNDGPNPNQGTGGNGGLVVFSGPNNPTGLGAVVTYGGSPGGPGGTQGLLGTIVAPDPATSTNTLIGVWRKTQPVELLTHAENLLLLTKNGGSTPVSANVFDRLLQSTIRSVADPSGTVGGPVRAEVISKNTGTSAYVFRNLILSSNRDGLEMALNHPTKLELPGVEPAELILPSALSNGQGFTTLNTLSALNDGPVSTQIFRGPNDDFPSIPVDVWLIGRHSNSLGGGRISILASGDITNNNLLGTVGVASGGSINIATKGTFHNGGSLGGLLRTTGNIHGGSIIAKAGQDIIHNFVHPFSQSSMTANGGLIGGTIRLLPQRDFSYVRTLNDARITANGSLQGGIIEIDAGNNSNIGPNPSHGEFTALQANGTSPTQGRGGFIHVNAGNTNYHDDAIIEANGGLEDGTVLFTTGN